MKNTFVIFLDHIPDTKTSKEIIAKHIEFLKDLDRSGYLVLSGPFSDHPSGMVIIRAETLDEAKQIAESDPFVQKKVRTYIIRQWIVANCENSYLG